MRGNGIEQSLPDGILTGFGYVAAVVFSIAFPLPVVVICLSCQTIKQVSLVGLLAPDAAMVVMHRVDIVSIASDSGRGFETIAVTGVQMSSIGGCWPGTAFTSWRYVCLSLVFVCPLLATLPLSKKLLVVVLLSVLRYRSKASELPQCFSSP